MQLIKDKFKKLLKNKEFILLLENFLSLSILKLFSAVVPFIAIPYLIKTLSFTNYGIIVFGLSVTAYFINICIYGFRVSGTRDVSKNADNVNYICKKVGSVFASQIFLLFIASLIYLLLLITVDKLYVFFNTYILFLPYMWAETLFPSWLFQGLQKMKYITIVNSVVKMFFTVMVFVLIKNTEDYTLYPIIISTGSVLAFIFTYIFMLKLKIKPVYRFNIKFVFSDLKENFTLFLNSVTPMLFANTTAVIMGFMLPTSVLGLYDAIRKIPMIISVFMQVVSETVFPFFNRKIDKFSLLNKYLLSIYFIVLLVPYFFYKIFFLLFNVPDVVDNFLVLSILIVGLIGVILSNVFGSNYLIVNRKEKLVLKSTIIGSLFGFIMAYPMVLTLGIVGGALNIALSQLILGGLIYYYYLKVKDGK